MHVKMDVTIDGDMFTVEGDGNGRLDAVRNALRETPYDFNYNFITYEEHALESDSDSRAAAYVAIADENGWQYWGCGIHNDIIPAAINALVSAMNRMNKVKSFISKGAE